MALYLVLEDFAAAGVTASAGSLLDSNAVDLPPLQSAGLAVVPYNPATMSGSLAAFLNLRGSRPVSPDSSGDLSALLLAAGAIGGSGGGVASVSAAAPLTSSGGSTPTIAINAGTLAGDVLTWDGSAWTSATPVDTGITELTSDVVAGPGSGSQSATVVAIQNYAVAATAPANGDVLTWDSGISQWQPATTATTGITELTGDVVGGPGTGSVAVTVAGIEGVPVDATLPTPGQVLAYDGTWWTPTTPTDTGITELTSDVLAGPGSGSQGATVVALQGNPVSSSAPGDGQVLTWNGSAWVPGAPAAGGSGGGGQTYFFNASAGQAPVVGLPVGARELGLVADVALTTITSAALPTGGTFAVVAGFVTGLNAPGLTAFPSGLWDFNVWAAASAPQPNTTLFRLKVYQYDGTTATLLATSAATPLYDPTQTIQYIASALIPQTAVLATDRLYIEVEATATNPGHTLTLNLGDAAPSHVHTTLPSVAGTGIVHVINGVVQSPASPVDLTGGASEISGVLPVSNGGTGTANPPTDGQLLIGKAATNDYALSTLTAGTGISITNGPGSITVAATAAVNLALAAVRVATTTALPANGYAAGVLTASAGGSINAVGIDGVTTLALADRVLVKDESSGLKNQVYEITALGAAPSGPSTPAVPAPPTFSGALLTCGSGGTYATLTLAIAAAAPGDRIQILPGTIVEGAAVAVNKSLEIFGSGPTCIVQRNSTTSVLAVTASNVYLHDFKIINNQLASADPGGQSACVGADTMNRTSLGGATGLYFADLECEMPKVGIFVSGTSWVVRDCSFAPSAANTTAGTTLRAVFAYGSEGTSFINDNTFLTPTDNARMTAIYLNTRNDGIAPAWEGGYKDSLVIDGNIINDGGGAPRSYIDATSIYHQSGTATTAPPTGQFSLYVVNNDFSLDHQSSPCVFFGRSYGGTPVAPLSFFLDLVVSDNLFGAREASASQKGALFWTNTAGGAVAMGAFVGGFYGANNTIDPMILPGTNTSIMADSSLLMVRENAYYNAPTPLLTLVPLNPGTPWSMTVAADFAAAAARGVFVASNAGTVNSGTSWIVVTADPITLGVTNLSWREFGPVAYSISPSIAVPSGGSHVCSAGDEFVRVAPTGTGNITVTLPHPAATTGRTITVKKTTSNATDAVSVAPSAGTIEGAAVAYPLPASAYSTLSFVSDGSGYWVI